MTNAESTRVALLFSDEIAQLISDNQIDIETELRRQDLNVRQTFEADPAVALHPSRDVVPMVLLVGVTLPLVATSIAKIIDAIARAKGPVIVEELELRPATNEKGDVLHDQHGIALMQWRSKQQLAEAADNQDRTAMTIAAGLKGLRFRFRSGGQHA